MGASNFWRLQNCSKIFSFGLNDYDRDEIASILVENDWESVPTSREIDDAISESMSQDCADTIDNVIYELKTKDFYWDTMRKWIWKDLKIIWYFTVPYYNREKIWTGEVKWWDENTYYIVVEYGYHEGERFDIVEDDRDYFIDSFINKTYNKKLQKTIKECEKIFAKYTTPMQRVGGFSDGTSIYKLTK